jgi:hypothetical protein
MRIGNRDSDWRSLLYITIQYTSSRTITGCSLFVHLDPQSSHCNSALPVTKLQKQQSTVCQRSSGPIGLGIDLRKYIFLMDVPHLAHRALPSNRQRRLWSLRGFCDGQSTFSHFVSAMSSSLTAASCSSVDSSLAFIFFTSADRRRATSRRASKRMRCCSVEANPSPHVALNCAATV